ncbi:MAG: tetratricopeptide repeat protein [Victivallaceae bacterium]|nr:tetratricopeptide repeat protein [Victivallaceae bacterium]
MPSTINGIGTNYVGKKNVEKYHGVCEQCGYQGELSSYETGYWFVVLFIPIIPLGKKKILDYCPSCRTHRYMSLKEWQHAGDATVEEVEKNLTEKRNDPDVAMDAHVAFVTFRHNDKAEALANDMQIKLRDNFAVHMYLGCHYERIKDSAKADELFEKALKIDPENIAAKRAVGIGCIEKGNLERARTLLSYLEERSKEQELWLLLLLAKAYQEQNDHDNALDIFKIICRDVPGFAGKDKKFRKLVQFSEQKVLLDRTILPPVDFNWRKTFWTIAIPAAVIIVCLILFKFNSYLKNNQNLIIANGLPVMVKVKPARGSSATVLGNNFRRIHVPEGELPIEITVGEQKPKTVTINIQNTLFQRFLGDNAFILNVDGAAVVLWEETEYQVNPIENKEYPYFFYVGRAFIELRDVDYIFESFPEKINLDSERSVVRKTRVSMLNYSVNELLTILKTEKLKAEDLYNFMEAHLRADPDNEELFDNYYRQAATDRKIPRVIVFFKTRLGKRPVNQQWHRIYQSLQISKGRRKEMLDYYKKLLDEDPDNSALLYLYGRILETQVQAIAYFNQAVKADRKNPYPLKALAYLFACNGDLKSAQAFYKKGYSITKNPDDEEMLFQMAVGLKQFSGFEHKYEKVLKKTPLNYDAFGKLLWLYLLQNKKAKAKILEKTYAKNYKKETKSNDLGLDYKLYVAYAFKNLKEYKNLIQKYDQQDVRNILLFQANIDMLNPGEAEKALKQIKIEYSTIYKSLYLFALYKYKNQPEKAEYWLDKTKKQLAERKSESDKLLLKLLNGKDDNVIRMLNESTFSLRYKPIICYSLSVIYPNKGKELKNYAQKLNFERNFPYYFINKVTEN